MPSTEQIAHYNGVVKRFEALKHKEQWGMRTVLTEVEKAFLDLTMREVYLHTILDHIAASTFEAADACDGDGAACLSQQAATIVAASLFCKTWGQP